MAASGLLAASPDDAGCPPMPGHGLAAAVPGPAGSGFTLMMEAVILLLGQQMSVSAAAATGGERQTTLESA